MRSDDRVAEQALRWRALRILSYGDERADCGQRDWALLGERPGRPARAPGRITGRGHRRPRLYRARIVTWSSLGFKYPGGWGQSPCWRDRTADKFFVVFREVILRRRLRILAGHGDDLPVIVSSLSVVAPRLADHAEAIVAVMDVGPSHHHRLGSLLGVVELSGVDRSQNTYWLRCRCSRCSSCRSAGDGAAGGVCLCRDGRRRSGHLVLGQTALLLSCHCRKGRAHCVRFWPFLSMLPGRTTPLYGTAAPIPNSMNGSSILTVTVPRPAAPPAARIVAARGELPAQTARLADSPRRTT